MAYIIADRVKETTTTTGTGPFTLAGTAAGYRAFSAVCSNGDTVDACIDDGVGNWLIATFTYSSGALTTSTIRSSSNGGAAVTFGAGTKTVFLAHPAAKHIVSGQPASLDTLTLTGSQSASNVLVAPAGSAGAPTWRKISVADLEDSANIMVTTQEVDPPNPIVGYNPTGGTANYGSGVTFIFQPPSAWSATNVGFGCRLIIKGSASTTGGTAHGVGGLLYTAVQNTSGTLGLVYGGESKVQTDDGDGGAGACAVTISNLIAHENQLAAHAVNATIGTLTLCNNKFVDAYGAITTVYGSVFKVENLHVAISTMSAYVVSPPVALNATVTVFVGLYWPSFGTIPGTGGISSKYLILCQDTGAILQTDGKAIFNNFVSLGSVATGLTASTTNSQAGALALTKQINEVTVVASAGHAVRLPEADIGTTITIYNATATSMNVYAPTTNSQQISSGSTNNGATAAQALAGQATGRYTKISATRWRVG